MTTFSSMSLHIRGFLLIWLLLLLYVGFLVLFRYIQRHRWWVRYIPLLALMLGEYLLYQIILFMNSDLVSGDAPGAIFRLFHDVPFVVYLAAMLVDDGGDTKSVSGGTALAGASHHSHIGEGRRGFTADRPPVFLE